MTNKTTPSGSGSAPSDEDVELLWQVTARAEEVLEHLADASSSSDDVRSFLNYLRDVVLARVSEEDRNLLPLLEQFPALRPNIERLQEEHLLLRDDVDALVAEVGTHGGRDAERLGELTRLVILRLEQHIRREAAIVASVDIGYRSASTDWADKAHWYPLTEGSHLDLDQLPPHRADALALNRLTTLRAGEGVELRGRGDADGLRKRLQRRSPNLYTWLQHPDRGDGWTVSVTRRNME